MSTFKNYSISFSPLICIGLFIVLFMWHYDLLNLHNVAKEYFTDYTVIEYRYRLHWGIASLILFYIILLNIGLSTYIIVDTIKSFLKSTLLVLIILAIFLILSCVVFPYIDIGGNIGKELLNSVENEIFVSISNFITISMAASATTVLVIVTGIIFLMIKPDTLQVKDLQKRYRFFRYSIFLTTAFLAAGIIQVFLLYRWSMESYNKENLNETSEILLADSLSFSGGIFYTTIFLTMFIPISMRLHSWAKEIAMKNIKTQNEEEVDKWLKNNDLYKSPVKTYGNFLLLVTPTIIPIIAEIINILK